VDLLGLEDAISIFDRHQLKNMNDQLFELGEMVLCLMEIFESIQTRYPDLCQNVPLQIDLCLNWLLNLYDPQRSGNVRVLSFKVALTLLCRAQLDEKYKCKFQC
jgi:dystrophin